MTAITPYAIFDNGKPAILPLVNPATLYYADGTNYPIMGLEFPAGTDAEAGIPFELREDYPGAGESLIFTIEWHVNGTATTGTVQWDCQVGAITPETDTTDVEADALGTEATAQDTHLGTTAQRLHSIDVTVTDEQSAEVGDAMMLYVRRDVSEDSVADPIVIKRILVGYDDGT